MAKKQTGEAVEPVADDNIIETNETAPLNEGIGIPDRPAQAPTGAPVAPQNVEPVIYCGPTLPKKLISMTIYRGGLPANIEALAKEIPEIRKMIVPVTRLNEMRTKIDTPGTEENRLYQVLYQEIMQRRSS